MTDKARNLCGRFPIGHRGRFGAPIKGPPPPPTPTQFLRSTHGSCLRIFTGKYSRHPLNTMTCARFLALLLTMAALLYAFADAYPRQFCSPNGEVCLGPLDCCSRQCVNAVCCDELLGTCLIDYPDYPVWKRATQVPALSEVDNATRTKAPSSTPPNSENAL
ncbi:secreted protein, putative [Ixodes scapularis]|uniref:Secreted protein, putative n=1 Tax=Ixodes scapularis TaxID=6945 RepID=B7P1W5_IXOSC|nr:secreted protein, putative [Ixodes scapularis]|eukprot:XP_002433523.1 secreted protein, putative [Ixodes scapularis]